VVLVQLTQRVPPNMVFIPFHFHECVNRLTLGLNEASGKQWLYYPRLESLSVTRSCCEERSSPTTVRLTEGSSF
jgi:hypothetical protein